MPRAARRTFALAVTVAVAVAALPPASFAATYRATGSIGAFYPYSSGFVYVHSDNYNVTGFADTGGGIFYHQNSNDPNNPLNPLGLHAQADSIGGRGYVAAHTFAQMLRGSSDEFAPTQFTVGSDSSVSAVYGDVVVASPPGGPASVTTRLNLHFHGNFIAGSKLLTNGGTTTTNNFVGIAVTVNNRDQTFGNAYYVSQNGNAPASTLSSGVLTNFVGGNVNFQTPFFTVPTNQPFSVQFELQTNATVNGPINRGLTLAANSDFADTFSFATDSPVFDLPAGYTASSADANILNNTFALPVPEPTLFAGGAAAVLLLGVRRRRRRSRACG